MDYILLSIARKLLKCTATHGNICLGALTGAGLTCVVAAAPIPYAFMKFILFHFVVNIAMIKAGLKIKWGRTLLKAIVVLYISGFLVGGIFEFLHQYVRVGSLFFILAVASYYLSSGVLTALKWFFHFGECRYKVRLCRGGRECTVCAILDTGNRLKDEITGKAVSIIDKHTARILLGEQISEGIRYIPYHTIGKTGGVLPVVTLDWLCIAGEEEQWVEKPLIGISEEKISARDEYEMILNPDI